MMKKHGLTYNCNETGFVGQNPYSKTQDHSTQDLKEQEQNIRSWLISLGK